MTDISPTNEEIPQACPKPAEDSIISPRFLLGLCTILLSIILIRAFIVEVYVVIGDSMDATLIDQERLLVTKYVPFGDIERGDILVFTHPDAPRKHLIKRVVACPGESVRIQAGRVYIRPAGSKEEIPLPEIYLEDIQRSASINSTRYDVPDKAYYVLGDNRHNSRDSRNFGAIDQEHVVGRAMLVIWPLGKFKGL